MRKLVLHFDINQTVVVADAAQSYGPTEALNAFLTTVVWGKEVPATATHQGRSAVVSGHVLKSQKKWVSCTPNPSLDPPIPGAISYYKYLEDKLIQKNCSKERLTLKEHLRQFTSYQPGEQFVHTFQRLASALSCEYFPKQVTVTDSSCGGLAVRGTDGRYYHYILPSFIHLLYWLHEKGRDFAVIFRSFGSDGLKVLRCLKRVFEGSHPDFNELNVPISVNMEVGHIARVNSPSQNDPKFRLTLPSKVQSGLLELHGGLCIANAKEVYNAMSNESGICAIEDDYEYWRDHEFKSSAAKPFILDFNDSAHHHIFFDDNFRVNAKDNIVDARVLKNGETATALSQTELSRLQDICLVQANLLESITNVNYFLEKIQGCEDSYHKFVS